MSDLFLHGIDTPSVKREAEAVVNSQKNMNGGILGYCNPNLLFNTTDTVTNTFWGVTGPSGSKSTIVSVTDPEKGNVLKYTKDSGTFYHQFYRYGYPLAVGRNVTLSMDVRGDFGSTLKVSGTTVDGSVVCIQWVVDTVTLSTSWTRLVWNGTVVSSSVPAITFTLLGGGVCYVANMKLEYGDVDSGFSSILRDSYSIPTAQIYVDGTEMWYLERDGRVEGQERMGYTMTVDKQWGSTGIYYNYGPGWVFPIWLSSVNGVFTSLEDNNIISVTPYNVSFDRIVSTYVYTAVAQPSRTYIFSYSVKGLWRAFRNEFW